LSIAARAASQALVLLLFTAAFVMAQERRPQAQPDILILMPDQMRGDCLSVLGHPVAHTPHFDGLARSGALFRRAYATVPSCIPARHAFLTGRFPQTTGVVGFAGRPITVPTLPQELAKIGYTTALVGRNMHQIPAREGYGYATQVLGSTYIDDDQYDRDLRAAAPESGGVRAVVQRLGLSFNGWEAKAWPLADDLHPTAWVVQQATKLLGEASARQPLFLTASFYAPHSPLFPTRAFFEPCLAAELPKPAHGSWVDWQSLSPKGDAQQHRVRLEGVTLRNAQAGYFAMIRQIDSAIGPLLEAFRKRSREAGRPWLVVVISDHGEMLGDHGYYRKCEPYEGSANIPFLIAGSDELGFVAGLRSSQPVCLEDLMPTLLELAGATTPGGLDGISLTGVLRGKTEHVRDWLHCEHADCYSREQAFQSLTDGHWKFIWRPLDGSEQLFDLDQDPHEEHDLAREEASHPTLLRWRRLLVDRLRDRPEGFSDGEKLMPGRPYPALPRQRR
jgi:arylsulfatase